MVEKPESRPWAKKLVMDSDSVPGSEPVRSSIDGDKKEKLEDKTSWKKHGQNGAVGIFDDTTNKTCVYYSF